MGRLKNLSPLVTPLKSRTPLSEQPLFEARRRSARQRGYTTEWDKASKDHLVDHPLCGYCAIGAFGPRRDEPATCTDHLYPQRQFQGVFWRREYWVSSCGPCHSGPKQAVELGGQSALDALARRLGLDPP